MKKLLLAVVYSLTVFLLMTLTVSAHTNTETTIIGEQIRDYNVSINIQKDGKMVVSERLMYDFSNEQRHGIFRTIPYIKENNDGKKFKMDIKVSSVVKENGTPYPYQVSDENNSIKLKIGDPNKKITGINTYIITYTVSGAITYFSDHDELYWNVTGNEWDVPIIHTDVSITLPEDIGDRTVQMICYTGYDGSNDQNCEYSSVGQRNAQYQTGELSPNQGLTAVIGFPKNIVAVVEPQEYKDFFDTPFGILVLIVMLLAAIAWYIIYPLLIPIKWLIHGRDPQALIGVVSAWYDAPTRPDGTSLNPIEAGSVLDETVDMHDISAMLVHLAQRGFIKIDERKKDDFYLIKMKEFTGTLQDYESEFLTGIFGGKKEIRIKDEQLSDEVEKLRKKMYKKLVEYKFFPHNPDEIRTFYQIMIGLATFTFNFPLILSAVIFGRIMPRKTLEGIHAANVSKSLRNFLKSQERQIEFQAKNQMMFEKLLPYAVAFGVERQWAQRFDDMDLKQPEWYSTYSGNTFTTSSLSNGLHSSVASFTSAATPTSSSSGFSSGFSGGSSGGGGGGGGGGSW